MKNKFLALCAICSLCFSAENAVDENCKTLVSKMFLTPAADPLLNMLATEAITKSGKSIDAEKVVQTFRDSMDSNWAKLIEPYKNTFTAEEIKQLKDFYELPVYDKFAANTQNLMMSNLNTLNEAFEQITDQFEVEEKEEIAANSVVQVTQDNFDAVVEQSKLPTIVDINATWCGPCKMMNPIIDELSAEYKGKIQFAKVDFDSNNDLAREYDVDNLPTVLFFKPGQKTPAMRSVGFMSKKDFQAKINEFLKK